jgi:hypothetical protein
MTKQEKITALNVYAEGLKRRLAGDVPPRHQKAPHAFKQMLEIDLKKTLADIEKLRA